MQWNLQFSSEAVPNQIDYLNETCMYCGLLRNIASHFVEVHNIRFVQVNFYYGDSGPGTLIIFEENFSDPIQVIFYCEQPVRAFSSISSLLNEKLSSLSRSL
jgi:hypothetical protein